MMLQIDILCKLFIFCSPNRASYEKSKFCNIDGMRHAVGIEYIPKKECKHATK